jgi:hypothetical protein
MEDKNCPARHGADWLDFPHFSHAPDRIGRNRTLDSCPRHPCHRPPASRAGGTFASHNPGIGEAVSVGCRCRGTLINRAPPKPIIDRAGRCCAAHFKTECADLRMNPSDLQKVLRNQKTVLINHNPNRGCIVESIKDANRCGFGIFSALFRSK